jgi:cytoskeletal protein CcmA (bactofilin family)
MSFLRGNAPRPDGQDPPSALSDRPGVTELQRPAPAGASPLPPRFEATREPLSLERGPAAPDKCTNVIAAGSKWKGSLSVHESVRIDGQLSGEVDAVGTVHIADGALVEAKIKAAFVVISGTFKGEIRCLERLDLLPKSKVQGELVTKVLNVQEGATIDGSIRMSAPRDEDITKGSASAAARSISLQTSGARAGRGPEAASEDRE